MYKVKAELYDKVFDKKKEAGGATSSAPTIQQVMSAECEKLHAENWARRKSRKRPSTGRSTSSK